MNKLITLWEEILIYIALFMGLKGLLSLVLQVIISPFLPSLLSMLQSPNYTFSPAVISSFVVQILIFVLAVILAVYFIKKFYNTSQSFLFSLYSTLLYAFYSLFPTGQLLLANKENRDYLLKQNSQTFLLSMLWGVVLFCLFFALTYYFSASRKKAKSLSSFLRGS